MEPIDFRNQTFADLQAKLHGQRLTVLNGWRKHGPCTTRELARRIGLDILSVRPRTTELCQLRLLKVEGEGNEGIYSAVSDAEVIELFEAAKRETQAVQTTMPLGT